MTVATSVALGMLAVAALLCLLRLVRGPGIANRVVALDTLLLVSVSAVAVLAIRSRSGAFLDALLIASVVAFVGTVTVARFMVRRGA